MNVVWYRLRVSESQRHTPIKIFPNTPPGEIGSLLHVVWRHCVNREVKQQEVFIFDLPHPPNPWTRPLQTIPHPRV